MREKAPLLKWCLRSASKLTLYRKKYYEVQSEKLCIFFYLSVTWFDRIGGRNLLYFRGRKDVHRVI